MNSLQRTSWPVFLWLVLSGSPQAHPGNEASLHFLDHELQRAPSWQGFMRRAQFNLRAGNLDAAEADMQRAEQLGKPVAVLPLRARLQQQRGQPHAAILSLDTYLDSHPHSAPALEQRARLLVQTGQNGAALADYRRLLETQPGSGQGTYLDAAAVALSTDGVAAALGVLDQGLQRLGIQIALQRRAIDYCALAGLYNDALRRQQSLRELMAASPLWNIQMAEAYWLAGDNMAARRQVQKLQAISRHYGMSPGLQVILQRGARLQSRLNQCAGH